VVLRHPMHAFLNIAGLALGLACFVVILLYVLDELSYDRHFKASEDIYRMAIKGEMSGFSFEAAVMGGPLGRIMQDELPEVTQCTRLFNVPRPVLFTNGIEKNYQEHILYADSAFFNIFNHAFISGNPETALMSPYTMVLPERIARKYFGDENPVGQSITWNNNDVYTITGIMKDDVMNTHMNFEVLASFNTLLTKEEYRGMLTTPFAFLVYNYIVVQPGTDQYELENKMADVVEKYMGEGMREYGSYFEIFLQPLKDIHLQSHLVHEMETNGNITSIYIFSGVAILILFIACINFINLTLAQSSKRALEVGLRKILGAGRKKLFVQYVFESVSIFIISMAVAVILIQLVLPLAYNVAGKPFQIDLYHDPLLFLSILLAVLIVVTVAGSYPAFYLSNFRPIEVLKGVFYKGSGRLSMRTVMVIIQFAASVFLIFSTMVIYRQLHLFQTMDMGINMKNIVVVPIRNQAVDQYEVMKNQYLEFPGIDQVTASSAYLGNFQQRQGFYVEGFSRNDVWMILNLQVDHNYLEMMEVEFIEGRNFDARRVADSNALIINRAMADEAGWTDPLGKFIYMTRGETETAFEVIGVVENFNYASLHENVMPIIIMYEPRNFRYMLAKSGAGDIQSVIGQMQKEWDEMFPDMPFDYFIQEDRLQQLYRAESNMGNLFTYFSIVAVMIASLGTLAMVLFNSRLRIREIGIRKVFGSSSTHILLSHLKEYLILIGIACLMAWPISWFFTHRWLENFNYKTSIPWWIYAASGVMALMICLLTIGYQTYRISISNPARSLRYE